MNPAFRATLPYAALAFAAAAAGRLGLARLERKLLYYPSREFASLPRAFGLRHEEVSLRTQDGVSIRGWFLPAGPDQGPLARRGWALMLCHGNAGNIGDRLLKARLLHRLGLSIFLFDYRGFGLSSGKPSEAGIDLDAEAAYRYLTEEKRFPPERVILYGESLGTGAATELALRRPALALILESPFTSVADMARAALPYLPVGRLLPDRFDNLSKIPRVRCPVLVLHSPLDEIVPFELGRRVFEAAPAPKEFFEMKGDHNEGFLDSGEAYPKAVLGFLDRLPPARAPLRRARRLL